ncbi:ABC transporter ATP-binding protein [Archaeoglobales archaeon]|nr:MAG: ABC transporter ATP-binding protein [Archaeoglobales archaeon]
MLTLSDVNSYYEKSHILFGVSLEIKEGEVVVLLGRNGVGKTTTLKTIMGLVPKITGKILFKDSTDLLKIPPHKRAKLGIGYVPDHGGIFPNLTVYQNMKLSIKQSKSKSESTQIFELEDVFDLFPQLEHMINRLAGTLSGGERRMLGIARGLLLNPDLLIIDEPSEGLAPNIVQDIVEIINKIRSSGVSVLVADQNLPFVEKIADRVYVIDKGEIKLSGKLSELSREELEMFLTF